MPDLQSAQGEFSRDPPDESFTMKTKEKSSSKKTVLITGAAGGLPQLVIKELAKDYDLVGVDPRPLHDGREFPGSFFQIDYQQRKMADVFRTNSFHALIHLGRVPVTSGKS